MPKELTENISDTAIITGTVEPTGIFVQMNSTASHRSPGGQEHVSPPFTVDDYDAQRPAEADPKTWEGIFDVCDDWYAKNGLIRNIIDLMADFCVAGIQISSPNPKEEAVLRKWFKKARGEHVSERIANMLYRLGNVGIRKQYARVEIKLKDKWQEIFARTKIEIDIPKSIKNKAVIPYKYVTIPPKYIRVPRPEVSAFLDEPFYGLCINKKLGLYNMGDRKIDNKALMKLIPRDIQEALTSGTVVRLDNDLFKMLHYKKDDFDKQYALPLIYAALSDLSLWSKMQLCDRGVVDSASQQIDFIKIGDAKTGLLPTEEHMFDFAQRVKKAKSATGSHSFLVTGPFLDIVSAPATLAAFLGKAKFEVVIEAIYATFGIPSALTGTASGSSANNFMSMKVLIKKLEYVRRVLVQDHWNDEVKEVHAAFNFESPFYFTFTYQELGDEAAIKKLMQDMHDREIISDETLRYIMGINHELEEHRIASERKQRVVQDRPPKASPYHNANLEEDLRKIALQGGAYTLEEAARAQLELDKQLRETKLEIDNKLAIKLMREQANLDLEAQQKQGEIDIEVAKNSPAPVVSPAGKPAKKTVKKSVKKTSKKGTRKTIKKQPDVPGKGRPLNKKDTTQRKKREYTGPRKK